MDEDVGSARHPRAEVDTAGVGTTADACRNDGARSIGDAATVAAGAAVDESIRPVYPEDVVAIDFPFEHDVYADIDIDIDIDIDALLATAPFDPRYASNPGVASLPAVRGAAHPHDRECPDDFDALASVAQSMSALSARRARLLARIVDDAETEAVLAADARQSAAREADPRGARWSLIDSRSRRLEIARRSIVAEIACAERISERAAELLIHDAQTLVNSLPGTLRALDSGTISYRHAQIILDEARSLPDGTRAHFEEAILPIAESITPTRLRRRARVLRERMHPDSIDQRARVAHDERRVEFAPDHDGMMWLNAYLPAAQASCIRARLHSNAVALRELAGEERTLDQLRADILIDLVRPGPNGALTRGGETPAESAGLSSGESDARHLRTTVFVTVPVLTLLGRSDEPADLHGFGPIDAATARELAGHAPSFIRLLTHPSTGTVLSVDRDRYSVPADLRRWLLVRDGTCRFPGCGRSAEGCEIDHTDDWQNGGSTTSRNLAHLCSHHHHLKHEGGWSVDQYSDGALAWHSPRRREYVTMPANSPPPQCE